VVTVVHIRHDRTFQSTATLIIVAQLFIDAQRIPKQLEHKQLTPGYGEERSKQ